jgi:adenylate kinase
MLRTECAEGTPLGREASGVLKRGGLVDDNLVNRILVSRLTKPDCNSGFLLDGYPRTSAQAEFLDGLLAERQARRVAFIHLDVHEEALVERLASRRECRMCGKIYSATSRCEADGSMLIQRLDDCEGAIRERLRTYRREAGPVINFYASREYHVVNGINDPDDVFREIEAALARVTVHGKNGFRNGEMKY